MFGNLFGEMVRRRGADLDRPALAMLLDSGEREGYSYGQMFELVRSYSGHLSAVGITRGDRVAIVAENSPEWAIAFLAIANLDCTGVTVDPSLSEPDIADLLDKCDVRGIAASPKALRKLTTSLPLFDILDGGRLCAGGASPPEPTRDPAPDVAVIFHSSGTTNTAKAVMQSYEAIMASARIIIVYNKIVDSDTFLAVVPDFHVFGFMANFVCPLLAGAAVCYIESATSESLTKAFVEYRPVVFTCVPRVFNLFKARITESVKAKGTLVAAAFGALLSFCSFAKSRLGINLGWILFKEIHAAFGGNLRGFISAGAYLDPETARFFDSLGVILLDDYGLTETGVPVAANTLDDHDFATNGKALGEVRLRIHDPDEDGRGEVRVKSPCMMKGYFRDPDATTAAFDDEGWFMTGDVGYVNARGNLVLTGRIKENIVLATGKKLSPTDVEARYPSIAGLKEFVVCGVPTSEGSADGIHAFIVKDEGLGREDTEIENDIREAGAALPAYMRVGSLHFVSDIPKTALAKPKRYLLRQLATQSEAPATRARRPLEEGEGNPTLELVHEVASVLNPSGRPVEGSSRFVEDLGFDSLSLTEFFAALRKRSGRDLAHTSKPNLTVDDVARSLEGDARAMTAAPAALGAFPVPRGFREWAVFAAISASSRLAYRIEVEGAEHLPAEGGYILCPNHETHLDGLWIMMHLPREHRERLCCMAKREHMDTPIGRSMLRIAGGIPVDRAGNTAPAYDRCLELLKEGSIVLIHPEGTRTRDGTLGPFKSGASKLSLESGLPIVPARIDGGFAVYPKGRNLPRFFDVRHGRRFRLCVSFGPPIAPPIGGSIEELTQTLKKAVVSLGKQGDK